MDFPQFKYHPDPIKTGAVVQSEEVCECCGKCRGYKAVSTIYAMDDVETICPWCISDGTAAEKYDGEFSDSHPLLSDGIDKKIVSEVCERTPSFISWQQERWLAHCIDACEFHGDAEKSDLENLSGEELNESLTAEYLNINAWQEILQNYTKGSSPAIYKLRCRACGKNRFYSDYN